MGLSSFLYRFRSLEEGIAEWGSEVDTKWDCEATEGEDSLCSDLRNEEGEQNAILIQCAKNLGFCEAYANRVPDLSPPHNYA